MIPLVAASEEGKAQAESDHIRIVEYEVSRMVARRKNLPGKECPRG